MICLQVGMSSSACSVMLSRDIEVTRVYLAERDLPEYPNRLVTRVTFFRDIMDKIPTLPEFAEITAEMARLGSLPTVYAISPFTVRSGDRPHKSFKKATAGGGDIVLLSDQPVRIFVDNIESAGFCLLCKKHKPGVRCPDFVQGSLECLSTDLFTQKQTPPSFVLDEKGGLQYVGNNPSASVEDRSDTGATGTEIRASEIN